MGRLPAGAVLDESELAVEVGVDPPVVREALCFLQRDGFVREADDGEFSVSVLDELELRETYPVVLLLEGLAVRSTPSYPADAIARLREINADMERDAADAAAAATHDYRFHEELAGHCDNDQLLGTLRPLKRRMLRYELAYMAERRNVGGSVSPACGDHRRPRAGRPRGRGHRRRGELPRRDAADPRAPESSD